MSKKIKKERDQVLTSTHIWLPRGDWFRTQVLASEKGLSGADMVRKWIREGLKREGNKNED